MSTGVFIALALIWGIVMGRFLNVVVQKMYEDSPRKRWWELAMLVWVILPICIVIQSGAGWWK